MRKGAKREFKRHLPPAADKPSMWCSGRKDEKVKPSVEEAEEPERDLVADSEVSPRKIFSERDRCFSFSAPAATLPVCVF